MIIRSIGGIPTFGGDGKFATDASLKEPKGIFATDDNELYIADSGNHVVRKVDTGGIISTIAGIPGKSGGIQGVGPMDAKNATLNSPSCVFVTQEKEVFICDAENGAVRNVSSGIISTVATGLGKPSCVFVTKNREIYICLENKIQKIDSDGKMQIVAGTGNSVKSPSSIYVTSEDEIYIADTGNDVVKKVANGQMSTVAGTENFKAPRSIHIVDQKLYILGKIDCSVVEVQLNSSTPVRTLISGSYRKFNYTGDDGDATQATFTSAVGMTINSKGEIFIADSESGVVRKIDNTKTIRHFAGINVKSDKADENTKLRELNSPSSILLSKTNEMYIVDKENHVIKKRDALGRMSILAGKVGIRGSVDDTIASEATLDTPTTMVVNEETQELFFSDSGNQKIRKIDLSNNVISTVVEDIQISSPQGLYIREKEIFLTKDQDPALLQLRKDTERDIYTVERAEFGMRVATAVHVSFVGGAEISNLPLPKAIVVTSQNETFMTDIISNSIHIYYPNGTNQTFIGKSSDAVINDELDNPNSIFIDESNQFLYATDSSTVKKYSMQTKSLVLTIGKKGKQGFDGDNKELSDVVFNNPTGITVSNNGSIIYVVDSGNNVIRKIAQLCEEYTFQYDLTTNKNSDSTLIVAAQANRTCKLRDSEYFEPEALPYVELTYRESKKVHSKLVFDQWNLPLKQWSNINIKSQYLDILDISLTVCGDENSKIANCPVQTKNENYATAPTDSSSNFLLFPSVVSSTFINFFKPSTSVSDFSLLIQMHNTKTNQTDVTVLVDKDVRTKSITGLRHSTLYDVNIVTNVTYTNGIQLSTTSAQQLTTMMGIAPLSSLIIEEAEMNNNTLLLTWNKLAVEGRGNIPIDRIEFIITRSDQQQETPQQNVTAVNVTYNAEENIPNQYMLDISATNQIYIQHRVCNDAGCSDFLELSFTPYTPSSLTGLITAITIPIAAIALCILCFALIIIVLLVLITVMVVVMLKRKKKSKYIQYQVEQALIDELVSKEFRIEEDKIDLTRSQFLGNGASGSVITAKYFKVDVAVKVIQKSSSGVENDLTDFYNELKFLNSNARHENIIRFFGVYDSPSNNTIGLVMELCVNGSIASYIVKHQNKLSFAQKLKFIQGIANGMQYLHFHNIAHRDLKCENVLLDYNLTPKIIDFGYSKIISEEANKSMNMTMNIGTAAYCAPEVIKLQTHIQNASSAEDTTSSQASLHSTSTVQSHSKLAYDKKCDVYSFAIIIFVIYFQNINPYGSNTTPNQILYQLSTNPEFRPKFDATQIPENEKWLIELMKQCWKTNPEERPSFEQICQQLKLSE